MSQDSTLQPSRSRSECASYVATVLARLGELYHQAETSLHEIPEYALTVLRSCGKTIAVEYMTRRGHPPENSESFFEIIDSKEFHQNSERNLRNELHWIREHGNRAAHPEEGCLSRAEAHELAPLALERIYRLTVKYLADRNQEAPNFTLPDEDSSNRMCGDAVLRDDADAQYRLGLRSKTLAESMIEGLTEDMDYLERVEISARIDLEYKEALTWFERAARENRKPEALFEQGLLYLDGYGVERDAIRAVDLFYEADDYGVIDASAKLGLFALGGEVFDSRGVVIEEFEETERAKEWLERAATHGHPAALNGLVKIYLEGIGVTEDTTRALQYAQSAADAGFPLAKLNLARLYIDGIGDERSQGESASLLEEAAEDGVHLAYWYLHQVYARGFGVPIDKDRANQFLERGCELAEPYALTTWAELSIQEDAPDREPRQEITYLLRVIDNPNAPVELRDQASQLLDHCIRETQTVVAGLLDRLVRFDQMTDDETEKLRDFIMYLGIAKAEPPPDEIPSRVSGWSPSRSAASIHVVEALANLLKPENSREQRREGAKALAPLVPGFGRWELLPQRISHVADKLPLAADRENHSTYQTIGPDVGRNDRCPCGSGRKYKRCCLKRH